MNKMKIENRTLTVEVESIDDILQIDKVHVVAGSYSAVFAHEVVFNVNAGETGLEVDIPHKKCPECGNTIIGMGIHYCSRCGKSMNGKEEF